MSGLITQTITGIGCCAAVLAGSTGVGANTARQLGEVGGRCPSREWELRAARGWRFLGAAQRVRESLVYDSADRNPQAGIGVIRPPRKDEWEEGGRRRG